MSNEKHYPTHPGAEHPPIMTCEIPLEEYESLKRENAELKKEIEFMHSNCKWNVGDGCARLLGEKHAIINEIAELKAKLESVQATAYAESVDAGMENRRLKRELWIARAARAYAEHDHWATIWFCDTNVELNINKSSVSQYPYWCTTKRNAAIWRNIWHDVERKCRAKAEEYK